jgi:hydrogenase nickel incorporation protein HypB
MNKDVIIPDEGEIFDIELSTDLLRMNKELANKNMEILQKNNVTSIDILGSIGSGKTSLIENLVQKLKKERLIAVIGGDVATSIDTDRVSIHGVDVVQINTGKECHLDANLVGKALSKIDLKKIDLLFIENVGNLICPSEFPVGADKRVVVFSVTEGPYTVVKHPIIFLEADLVVINKIDLAEAMKIDISRLENDIRSINSKADIISTDCRKGIGIDKIIKNLKL